MATPFELYATEINAGFQRFRALLFTVTLFCALLLSNAYIERFSIDEQQLQLSELVRTGLEKERQRLRAGADPGTKAVELSILSARLQRIDNSMKEYRLREVTLPILGLVIAANDVNVIVGLFIVALSAWLLMSLRQLQLALEDREFSEGKGALLPALRHATVILYAPPGSGFVSGVVFVVLALPPIALALAGAQDLVSVLEYDQPLPSGLYGRMVLRAVLLGAMFAFLLYVSIQLVLARAHLTGLFYPPPRRSATE